MTNTEIVKGSYDAFGRGDVAAALSPFAPDIDWAEADGSLYPGTFVGPEAVLKHVFFRFVTEWEGFAAAPTQFVAEGDTVVALGRYVGTYRATGKSIDVPFAHIWTMKDGKAVRFRQHTDTAVIRRVLE